ncbi:response regulator transcription factor [Mahella australiensis]|uniref:Stage 0 sporulation protein A homolog n=1 Tax=Mahella australiensis (strain DSM 15567 / CIP 107919 / 50-1 BON) TaxID=697281 RepID=F4A116_MAHA5|nr:response regulator [Mahella australiensis]AEE98093.1 two component transcriptional regulator, AraC family [Mahella australiensis 50-1 BON]
MLTILIADDEPLVRSSIRYTLQEISIKTSVVGEAENGEEALEFYRRLLPDVIIVDIKMPLMSGLEFIEEVRKIDHVTQFIVVSGYAEFEYARQAMRSGVNSYVLKPVKSSELEEALKKCILQLKDKYEEMLSESDKIIRYIEQNFSSPLTLEILAEKFNFSPKYISVLIKNKVGYSFTDYLTSLRIKRAVELITKTNQSVKSIAMSVGYDDPHYFDRIFKKKTGKTPSEFRENL